MHAQFNRLETKTLYSLRHVHNFFLVTGARANLNEAAAAALECHHEVRAYICVDALNRKSVQYILSGDGDLQFSYLGVYI